MPRFSVWYRIRRCVFTLQTRGIRGNENYRLPFLLFFADEFDDDEEDEDSLLAACKTSETEHSSQTNEDE